MQSNRKHQYQQNDPGSGALRSDKLFVSSNCEDYAQAAIVCSCIWDSEQGSWKWKPSCTTGRET